MINPSEEYFKKECQSMISYIFNENTVLQMHSIGYNAFEFANELIKCLTDYLAENYNDITKTELQKAYPFHSVVDFSKKDGLVIERDSEIFRLPTPEQEAKYRKLMCGEWRENFNLKRDLRFGDIVINKYVSENKPNRRLFFIKYTSNGCALFHYKYKNKDDIGEYGLDCISEAFRKNLLIYKGEAEND
ncbi:hypothetical protein AAEX28_04770 [Lentisphaerota bacterium WC36G]|nr:hypothetical protein LJT99_07630 [Lentisphaerae bacterium WC36]